MADADDGQLADLAPVDELADRLVVPRIAQIEVDGREERGLLDKLYGLPFVFDAIGDGLFGDNVLSGGDGPGDLFRTRVGKGAQGDGLDRRVVEQLPFVGHDLRAGGESAGCGPCFG